MINSRRDGMRSLCRAEDPGLPCGFTLIDTIIALVVIAVLICIVVPTLGETDAARDRWQSMHQLRQLGEAQFAYASDWDGRQLTLVRDDFSTIINRQNGGEYSDNYDHLHNVPAVPLGFDGDGNFVTASLHRLIGPHLTASNCSFGSFWAWNTRPFNQYVNGRVYEELYWAPHDRTRTLSHELHGFLQDPAEFPGYPVDDGFYGAPWIPPTYSMSLAAMYDPRVFANDGGDHPLDLKFGHRAPALSQARYPDQKTFMLEHYWLNVRPPDSGLIPGTNVQWFFHLSLESRPGALFYDGHTRLFSTHEAVMSDRRVLDQGGPSLVAGDPGCFGGAGYFENYAFNDEDINSYHVFTADGILGRDTVIPE